MKIEKTNPERIFLFVDETGDPGHPDQRDSSRFYLLNVVIANREGMRDLIKHFSRFRYFREAKKELKNYNRHIKTLCDLFQICSEKQNISFYSFYLDKSSYVGPYLKKFDVGKFDYNPTKFRNFVIKKSLEKIFDEILPTDYDLLFQYGLEIEVVFDRFLINEDDERNLKEYLRGNYKLPEFLHIVQVDSEYSDLVQMADMLGRLVKRCGFDGKDDCSLNFLSLFCLEKPDHIQKRKRPGHP